MTQVFRPTGPVYSIEVVGGQNGYTYPNDDTPNVVRVTNTGTDAAVAFVAVSDIPDSLFYGKYATWPDVSTNYIGTGVVVMPGTSQLIAVNTFAVDPGQSYFLGLTAATFSGGDAGNVLFTSGSLE
jgi:hypothetical protein